MKYVLDTNVGASTSIERVERGDMWGAGRTVAVG
jgi:hypothetical protein